MAVAPFSIFAGVFFGMSSAPRPMRARLNTRALKCPSFLSGFICRVFNRGKIVMARFRMQIGGRKRHRLSISALTLLCPGAAKSDQQTMRDERHKGCRQYARSIGVEG
ncbi:MAG: hypothetical protein KGK33_03505 [Hyphomicrobiales bacterium]|nr:hypothetical protein [Hyphomicrobiales bacterium]